MTDRGLPIVDGAPACPFVAFEDDRDARATAPDHGHRCYAEPRPAPRALAHQEAYCLSSAFPVCPAFQDWARREAAAARPAPRTPGPAQPVTQSVPVPAAQPLEGVDGPVPPLAAASLAAGPGEPQPLPPKRNPQRDWAAPPPWAGEPGEPEVSPPPFLAKDDADPFDDWSTEGRGLAGSSADQLAGPDPDLPPAASTAPRPGYDDLDDDWAGPAAGMAVAGTAGLASPGRQGPAPAPSGARTTAPSSAAPRYEAQRQDVRSDPTRDARPPASRQRPPAPARRRPQEEASELFGPAWEQPRRYEAYPSLRTRIGLAGAIPRVAIAAGALVLAAVALFFIGPMLLGIGGNDTAKATPTPVESAAPTLTPEPTEAPPTPQVYVVQKGDTFSKIANKFGVTVVALQAANPQIKNVNRINIGDEITIPVPVQDAASDGTVQDSAAP